MSLLNDLNQYPFIEVTLTGRPYYVWYLKHGRASHFDSMKSHYNFEDMILYFLKEYVEQHE